MLLARRLAVRTDIIRDRVDEALEDREARDPDLALTVVTSSSVLADDDPEECSSACPAGRWPTDVCLLAAENRPRLRRVAYWGGTRRSAELAVEGSHGFFEIPSPEIFFKTF